VALIIDVVAGHLGLAVVIVLAGVALVSVLTGCPRSADRARKRAVLIVVAGVALVPVLATSRAAALGGGTIEILSAGLRGSFGLGRRTCGRGGPIGHALGVGTAPVGVGLPAPEESGGQQECSTESHHHQRVSGQGPWTPSIRRPKRVAPGRPTPRYARPPCDVPVNGFWP
jgi:hypothetical protein